MYERQYNETGKLIESSKERMRIKRILDKCFEIGLNQNNFISEIFCDNQLYPLKPGDFW